jgi:hypothetical protein
LEKVQYYQYINEGKKNVTMMMSIVNCILIFNQTMDNQFYLCMYFRFTKA